MQQEDEMNGKFFFKRPLSFRQSIIKRFNQHSIMVMKATSSSTATATSVTANGASDSAKEPEHSSSNPTSRKRLREKLEYEDLGDKRAGGQKKEISSSSAVATSDLSLNRVDRYLSGPTAAAAHVRLTSEETAASR